MVKNFKVDRCLLNISLKCDVDVEHRARDRYKKLFACGNDSTNTYKFVHMNKSKPKSSFTFTKDSVTVVMISVIVKMSSN